MIQEMKCKERKEIEIVYLVKGEDNFLLISKKINFSNHSNRTKQLLKFFKNVHVNKCL